MMVIEKFITNVIKKNNKKYLQFSSSQTINLPENIKEKKYLLYIHIPFCEKLCPYCSFNRYPFELTLAQEYFKALHRELKLYREAGYDCDEIYIGGGTPTILMNELSEIINTAKKIYSVGKISLETNPNHITRENIELLKEMKINRLSIGVQSFNNSILRSVERLEKYGTGEQIKEKLLMAQNNFDTLNVDMIFNFPNQTQEMLEYDIDTIIKLEIDQVTFYPLMYSKSENIKILKNIGKIDYKKEKYFYSIILKKLKSNFQPATTWCFSKNKNMIDEYIVNHDEYLGTGCGSFGYLNGSIIANTFSVQEYINKLQNNELPISFSKQFSKNEQMQYDFLIKLFSMRLNLTELNDKYSDKFYNKLWKEISFFRFIGALTKKDDDLLLTEKGMYYWIIMMREFFTSVNNFRDYCRKYVEFSE